MMMTSLFGGPQLSEQLQISPSPQNLFNLPFKILALYFPTAVKTAHLYRILICLNCN